DYLSKWVEAKALPTNDARVVVKFLKSLFSWFRTPKAIISDRGTHFYNDQFTKVMSKYGVTHRLSTAYHPQTSGQVNELHELRDQAYENSLIYKERMKKLHDSKIKNRIFNVGDQVLLFNSRLKIFSGKLKTGWSGLFTITEVYPYGTAKLAYADGSNFKVNCHRLKHYYGGEVPPMALPTNDARVVVKFLKSLFSWFRTPKAIISDRGTHFYNDQFTKVMSKYGVTHRLSTAYHPQTSGQVEVNNRGLKRILERTVGENRASWTDKLDDALWAFRMTFKTLIGCTPYRLVYGKSCHLPLELEHKAYWALKHANFDLKTIRDHRKL
nr:reverse transcriptase domain-containing protein [Tanacetum cinerariifolium]